MSLAHILCALEAAIFERPWSFAQIESALQSPDYLVILLDQDGQLWNSWQAEAEIPEHPAGYCLVWAIRLENLLEIQRIGVVREARNQGLAGKILQYLDNINTIFFSQPYETILEVAASNDAALRLYFRQGFREISRRRNYYGNQDGLVLRKEISGSLLPPQRSST